MCSCGCGCIVCLVPSWPAASSAHSTDCCARTRLSTCPVCCPCLLDCRWRPRSASCRRPTSSTGPRWWVPDAGCLASGGERGAGSRRAVPGVGQRAGMPSAFCIQRPRPQPQHSCQHNSLLGAGPVCGALLPCADGAQPGRRALHGAGGGQRSPAGGDAGGEGSPAGGDAGGEGSPAGGDAGGEGFPRRADG